MYQKAKGFFTLKISISISYRNFPTANSKPEILSFIYPEIIDILWDSSDQR